MAPKYQDKRTNFIIMMHGLWKTAYAKSQEPDCEFDLEKAWAYFQDIENNNDSSPKVNLTPNGEKIVKAMQSMYNNQSNVNMWTAREIGESYNMSSASVSGGMRKLISDGIVEKGNPGGNTTFYKLTDIGLLI